jgi:hypothetical protein
MRSTQDWAALLRAEQSGKEPRGTVARMISEATGYSIPTGAADGGDVTALVKLVDAVTAGGLPFKQRLAELKKATEEARAAVVEAGRERAAVASLRADVEAERVAQATVIAKELKDHQAAMEAAHAELTAVEARAAELKAKSEQDAAEVAKQKARLAEKLRLIEAA